MLTRLAGPISRHLVARLGGARLVLLGEPSHGDGTAVRLRSRVIRYLHEVHGFEIVTSESGMYDADLAWRELRENLPWQVAFNGGVHFAWSLSAELQPLGEYIAQMRQTARPLELAGFDSQLSGANARRLFSAELRRHLRVARLDTLQIDGWTAFAANLDELVQPRGQPVSWSPEQLSRFVATVDALSSSLTTQPPHDRQSFWLQLLRNVRAYAQQSLRSPPDETSGLRASNLRDAAMADNLLWLVGSQPRTRRIVGWGANVHTARDMASVGPTVDGDSMSGFTPMGAHVARSMGKDAYSIGFIASGGEAAAVNQGAGALPTPGVESLEGLFRETGAALAFLDLRALAADATWLLQPLDAGPFGYAPRRAVWPQVFDGLIYLRDMEPMHARPLPQNPGFCDPRIAVLRGGCRIN